MASAKITDQCLWLAHIEEGDVKRALQSVHAGSLISMLVDGEPIDFQRMATGKDGRPTNGFNPVGENLSMWRDRYVAGIHQTIDIDFAGRINAGD
jgi:hypothetical protein